MAHRSIVSRELGKTFSIACYEAEKEFAQNKLEGNRTWVGFTIAYLIAENLAEAIARTTTYKDALGMMDWMVANASSDIPVLKQSPSFFDEAKKQSQFMVELMEKAKSTPTAIWYAFFEFIKEVIDFVQYANEFD